MSIVTFVWSKVSAVCLTIGAIYSIVWLSRRDEPAVGVVAGRRRGREQQQQAQAQAQTQSQQRAQATRQQMDNFKKAFSVCLESKNYMVKF